MLQNIAYEFYPAQIYHSTEGDENIFKNYWYHYAVSWSVTEGLHVYLNGEPVGRVTIGNRDGIYKHCLLSSYNDINTINSTQ